MLIFFFYALSFQNHHQIKTQINQFNYHFICVCLIQLKIWLLLILSDLTGFRKRNNEENTCSIMEEDLRICTVRPVSEGDRRFCFEVISPTK